MHRRLLKGTKRNQSLQSSIKVIGLEGKGRRATGAGGRSNLKRRKGRRGKRKKGRERVRRKTRMLKGRMRRKRKKTVR